MPLGAGQIMEYAEKRALQAAAGSLVTASGTAPFLALLTAAPAAGTDLTMAAETEVATATGYARQGYTVGTPSSASPSVISNSNAMTFGAFTSAPGTITWGMLTDASSGTTSNVEIAFLLTAARTPLTGDSVQAAASSFTCQV
jgi:hypothetical protein